MLWPGTNMFFFAFLGLDLKWLLFKSKIKSKFHPAENFYFISRNYISSVIYLKFGFFLRKKDIIQTSRERRTKQVIPVCPKTAETPLFYILSLSKKSNRMLLPICTMIKNLTLNPSSFCVVFMRKSKSIHLSVQEMMSLYQPQSRRKNINIQCSLILSPQCFFK